MENIHLVYITYGPLKSAAYNRARFMGAEVAKRGAKVSLVVDNIEENNSSNRPWVSDQVTVHYTERANHITDCLKRRRLIRSLGATHVVHLGSSLKGVLSLTGIGVTLVAEWDEPRHLLDTHFLKKMYFATLRRWMLQIASVNIACCEALLDEGVYDTYIPHGDPTEGQSWNKPESTDGPATYMGNLYPEWDHGLVIRPLVDAAKRGFKPKIRIIGGGEDFHKWKSFADENSLDNLELTGPVYGNEMIEKLASSSVLFYPATDTPLNRSRCSTKLFIYAAVERPVLAHDVGEAKNILGGNMVAVPPGGDLIEYLELFQNGEIATASLPKRDNSYQDRSQKFLTHLGIASSTQ